MRQAYTTAQTGGFTVQKALEISRLWTERIGPWNPEQKLPMQLEYPTALDLKRAHVWVTPKTSWDAGP